MNAPADRGGAILPGAILPGEQAGEDILFQQQGPMLLVTLNRAKALNALTHEMAVDLHARLQVAETDPAVKLVVIQGSGDKAFCAGGDIVRLYDEGRANEEYPYNFYRDEYHLNSAIFHFPKPYIAIMDGFVMGGGVGVSVHGSHRVVTERVSFAMPETGIGLFPDVGGGHFLSRLPHQIGLYMAMTGARLKAADALLAEVGDVFIASDDLAALLAELAAADYGSDAHATVTQVLQGLAGDPGAGKLQADVARIEKYFSAPDLVQCLARLRASGDDWAQAVLATMAAKSPTSMHLAFRQIRNGATMSFNQVMAMEYRIATGCIEGHDFYEGVRAVVIDKDQAPKWQPAGLDAIGAADVDDYFEKAGHGGDLTLPAGSAADYHRPRM